LYSIIGDVLIVNKTQSFTGNVNIIGLTPILLVNIMHKMKSPIVEQVFLIHKDGRLISYASIRSDYHQDEELVSGMLTAVKDLLTVVFAKKEAGADLGPFRFAMGEMNVILRTGRHFYMTTVIRGEEDKAISDKSEAVVKTIQERYGDVFYNWLGEMKSVEGVYEIITQLLPLEELSEAERETIKNKGLLKKVFELWSRIYDD